MTGQEASERRPPEFRISLARVLDLPRRFCHPPEATAAKVRSCSIVPLYEVSLDDVLERRHLPPLGLKDFEEYLLFVDGRPQLLYFLLWLKEYRKRHRVWSQQQEGKRRQTQSGSSLGLRPISSPLSLFFTRAKHTFFSDKSQYCLGINRSVLKPIIQPEIGSIADSPHPDPRVFDPIDTNVRDLLSVSLKSFIRTSFANVSSYRAVCGVIGGCLLFTVLGLIPLLVALFKGRSRWWRLFGLPGMIAGVAILISSFYGICFGIYVFGDARQLRPFELLRPAISAPAARALQPVADTEASLPQHEEKSHRHLSAGPAMQVRSPSYISVSSAYSQHLKSRASSVSSVNGMGIWISPAMDPDTGEYAESLPEEPGDVSLDKSATATFIKPVIMNGGAGSPQPNPGLEAYVDLECPPIIFDFDGLPNIPKERSMSDAPSTLDGNGVMLELQQCEPDSSRQAGFPPPPSLPPTSMEREDDAQPSGGSPVTLNRAEGYGNVPLFAPLTTVLSPVVVRAQWEVAVRSCIISMAFCTGIMAGLLAIPDVARNF